MDNLATIAQQFIKKGKVIKVEELGDGNINQTFLISVDGGIDRHFVLQQINTQVFVRPELVMDNITLFVESTNQKLSTFSLPNNRRWQVPQVLFTSDNKHHYLDSRDCFWRAITFIKNTRSFNKIQSLEHAKEIGCGLGVFHTLISDLDVTKLADTLPGFHITPKYLKQYEEVISNVIIEKSFEVKYCQQFIAARIELVNVLEKAKERGILKLRPIHGDPKINNILINKDSKRAIAMIDLDTIKPGLIHYDLGDCLRSGCNILGEETQEWQKVSFDLQLAEGILQGYLSIAGNFIEGAEISYIYDSIRLITFELGLRFFTDYLKGNVYFKTEYPKHNLIRALVQFKLTKSIEKREKSIRNSIASIHNNL